MALPSVKKSDCFCGDTCKDIIGELITIFFGPYDYYGLIKHRTWRFRELIDDLEAMGHTVLLVPINFLDRLEISIRGRIISRCKITEFELNTVSINENPVCEKAILSVMNILAKLNNRKSCKSIK